ncbi:AAA+ ATPase superfamily protein YifB/ComM, associated with DNA recombination [hydrothermal vent metagenome]|uniref:AAA+ ATPase superfamily protein YifB/ComM, associated with DNA recombination n=1 Tax=hydrothermal vent metagenome TaxID=652676 RepID=A0A3B0Z632_9ZZZZ
MNFAIAYCRALVGASAPLVIVEVHIANGLPSFSIVGLPETAVKESKDRVRAALLNSHFTFPRQRITVNLAPADIPKEGSRFDLAIAIGLLAASGQIPNKNLEQYEFVGELALNGLLRPASGALATAAQTKSAGRTIFLQKDNAAEALLIPDVKIIACNHLLDLSAHLHNQHPLPLSIPTTPTVCTTTPQPDMSEVIGQAHARRALEVAAAGGHNLIMIGPPGTGKTMLASRLPSIQPELTVDEALETAVIHSVSSLDFQPDNWRNPPFRAPHHTSSAAALVGGGSVPKPGEVSLAHNGVLFLDELTEFNRHVLNVLREPLEAGRIIISRAQGQAEFPAQFQLIAAMNPCPCGYLNDRSERCQCTEEQVNKYRSRVSGPLLDRIDLHIEVQRSTASLLSLTHPDKQKKEENSATIRKRVISARTKQIMRTQHLNSKLTTQDIITHCQLKHEDHHLLEAAIEKLQLSGRAFQRILKVARTLADLDGKDNISREHLTEAISYRQLDRGITRPSRSARPSH